MVACTFAVALQQLAFVTIRSTYNHGPPIRLAPLIFVALTGVTFLKLAVSYPSLMVRIFAVGIMGYLLGEAMQYLVGIVARRRGNESGEDAVVHGEEKSEERVEAKETSETRENWVAEKIKKKIPFLSTGKTKKKQTMPLSRRRRG